MPTIRGEALTVPVAAKAAVLAFSSTPTGGFRQDLDYELVSCTIETGSLGVSSLTFRRLHGTASIKSPSDAAIGTKKATDILGQWVTLRLVSGAGGRSRVQFVGLVTEEEHALYGSDEDGGEQYWTAYGPAQLLDKVDVATAVWEGSVTGEFVPGFNERDELGQFTGNRTTSAAYLFGGEELWTRRQAIDYLLANFADTGSTSWSLSGELGLLDASTDAIRMGQSQTLLQIVRRLISPRFGVDFVVEQTSSGFTIRVFSLSADAVQFGSAVIPANTRHVRIDAGSRADIQVNLHRSLDQRYSSIRIRGARIVACFSLYADGGTIENKWSSAEETEYNDGAGSEPSFYGVTTLTPEIHDAVRRRPRLAHVYTSFGLPRSKNLGSVQASPVLDSTGALSADLKATHQSVRRNTLDWTPLRRGYDYSNSAETFEGLEGHVDGFRPPMAWVYDPLSLSYVDARALGYSVRAAKHDWGLVVRGEPAHLLGEGLFGTSDPTEVWPMHRSDQLVLTLAVRTDKRLTVSYALEDGTTDGSVLELEVPGAELWYVAPGTAHGVDSDGSVKRTGQRIVVRDDSPRLEAVMAGAIARYLKPRGRGEVRLRGKHAWGGVLGSILTEVGTARGRQAVAAPITSVTWGPNSTEIRAGYSRR